MIVVEYDINSYRRGYAQARKSLLEKDPKELEGARLTLPLYPRAPSIGPIFDEFNEPGDPTNPLNPANPAIPPSPRLRVAFGNAVPRIVLSGSLEASSS